MTTKNQPLQQRAGRNIGIEPSLFPFIQASASPTTVINPGVGSKTVIVECPEKTARTPLLPNESTAGGLIFNTTASDAYFDVLFVDAEGNEIRIGTVTATANADSEFRYADNIGQIEDAIFVLTPGEKIVLQRILGLP